MQPEKQTKDLLTVEETCETLGIARTKLYQLMDGGLIQAKKLGKLTMFTPQDINDFVANLPSYVPNQNK